jgi:hypothetical protein
MRFLQLLGIPPFEPTRGTAVNLSSFHYLTLCTRGLSKRKGLIAAPSSYNSIPGSNGASSPTHESLETHRWLPLIAMLDIFGFSRTVRTKPSIGR